MKKILLLTTFCLLATGAELRAAGVGRAGAPNNIRTVLEARYLLKKFEFLKQLDAFNREQINTQLECLHALTDRSRQKPNLPEIPRKTVSMSGTILERQREKCIDWHRAQVEIIKKDMEQARIALSLFAGPTKPTLNLHSETLDGKIDSKIALRPAHHVSLYWKLFQAQPLSPLSPREIAKARAIYDEFSRKTCLEYVREPKAEKLCEDGFLKIESSLSFPEKDAYWSYSKRKREEFRKHWLKIYIDTIQSNPALLFVDDQKTLDIPAMIDLWKRVADLARLRSEEIRKLEIRISPDGLSSEPVMAGQARRIREALMSIAGIEIGEMTIAGELSQEGWSDEAIEQTSLNLREEFHSRETFRSLVLAGAVVATNIACALPLPGVKLAALPLRLFGIGCLAAVGIPVNAYFLYGSLERQERAFKVFLSQMDEEYRTIDFETVMAGDSEVILTSLLLPIGSNLKLIKSWL